MKFKLDENLSRRGLEFLKAAGHDVRTVHEQKLGGATDDVLFAACTKEGRALVTLDHVLAMSFDTLPNAVPVW